MEKFRARLSRDAILKYAWMLLAFVNLTADVFGIRDVGGLEKHICRNTVQGRYLLSDDNGYVCTALSVNSWSRCCPEVGEQFSCQGCNLVSKCCSSYEYCVSCCLNPSRTQKDLATKIKIAKRLTAGNKLTKPLTAGTYASVFDFCSGRCRHNSASVVHENAYASDFHHCFSLHSNLSGVTGSNFEARLTGINIVIGRQGESCNSACNLRGQSCVPSRLHVLNKCELLLKHMSCKASCFPSAGADQPAEVADDAPKDLVHISAPEDCAPVLDMDHWVFMG